VERSRGGGRDKRGRDARVHFLRPERRDPAVLRKNPEWLPVAHHAVGDDCGVQAVELGERVLDGLLLNPHTEPSCQQLVEDQSFLGAEEGPRTSQRLALFLGRQALKGKESSGYKVRKWAGLGCYVCPRYRGEEEGGGFREVADVVVGFLEEPEGEVGFLSDPGAEQGGGKESFRASTGEEVKGPGRIGVGAIAEVVLEELFFGAGPRGSLEGEKELGKVPHGEGRLRSGGRGRRGRGGRGGHLRALRGRRVARRG